MKNTTPMQIPLFDPVVIKLTKGYEAMVDPSDADLARYRWHFCDRGTSHCARRRDYSIGGKNGTLVSMHTVVLERILGRSLAKGELCDHRDRNPLNNCRSNLRLATKAQNAWNSKRLSTNTSGYKGVHLDKSTRKWEARIKVNNQLFVLGQHLTPEKAYEVYCEAALKYRGEFARLE